MLFYDNAGSTVIRKPQKIPLENDMPFFFQILLVKASHLAVTNFKRDEETNQDNWEQY